MPSPRIALKSQENFSDPFGLNYNKYVRQQAEKVSLFETVYSRARDPEHDKKLDPAYIEAITPLLVASRFGEHAAHRYCTTAASTAPFSTLRDCCFYQAADERRHSEMDAARLQDFGISEKKAMEIWMDELPGARAVFEYLEGLTDPYQILFCANFVCEGSAGASVFPHWAELARINGDYVTFVINRTRFSDEVRHIGYTRALVRALMEEDPSNAKIFNEWLPEFLGLVVGLMTEVVARSNDRAPHPYKTAQEWGIDGFAALQKSMIDVGLDPTVLPTAGDSRAE